MKISATVLLGAAASLSLTSAWDNSTTSTSEDALKGCSYTDTCSVRRVDGICVSSSSGCCTGSLSSGYCPGSNDVQCCTSPTCSTPKVMYSFVCIFFCHHHPLTRIISPSYIRLYTWIQSSWQSCMTVSINESKTCSFIGRHWICSYLSFIVYVP
jgi:hypothetical protein